MSPGRRRKTESDLTEGLRGYASMAAIVVERALPQPLLRQEIEIDIGDDILAALGKSCRFRQDHAIFDDRGLPIPGEIGGRFAFARRRIEIGCEAPR